MVATMVREDWMGYVQRITAGVPRETVARAAGVHVTGVYRWLRDQNRPRAEKVVGFARGLNQSRVEALIAAGYLAPEEVEGVIEVLQSRKDLSDDELIAELADRLADRLAKRPPRTKVDDVTHRLSRIQNENVGEGLQNG